MGYSKIKFVEVTNFMSFKHARVSFDDKGIINLKGYNNSGKSSMCRAIAVCLMNMFVRSQAKFIHHGEDYFRIVVSFDDNVDIVRDKYRNGQSLYEMYKDGKCVFSTKEGNKLTKVDDVPNIIKNYLGLISLETGGYLNYQTRKEPLWLIETKGSENYYALNEVLKSEELAKANTILNSDKNKLNGEIVGIEAELQHSEMMLDSYKSVNEELITALSEREIIARGKLSRVKAIQSIDSTIKNTLAIEAESNLVEIGNIDSSRLNNLLEMRNIISKSKEVDFGFKGDISKVSKNNTDRLSGLNSILSTVKELSSVEKVGLKGSIDRVEVESIANRSRVLRNINDTIKSLVEVYDEIAKAHGDAKSLMGKKAELLAKASEQGISFVECENCGSLVSVGGDV